jgi:hypothetical protein
MGFAGNSIRAAAVFASLACAGRANGAAACEHGTYAYADRVVVFACDKQGAPELQVIVLDDERPIAVAGRLSAKSSRLFDTAGHFRDYLMLIRWDQFEVYDLSDAAHPRLAANFVLHKRGTFAGFDRIEQVADTRFVATTSLGAVELATDGEPAQWIMREIATGGDLQKKRSQSPPAWQYVDQNLPKVVLKETPKFRYELAWREKNAPGEVFHRQYLRKLDVSTGKAVSELLLGEHLETID